MTTTYLDLINRGAGYYPERTAIVFGDRSLCNPPIFNRQFE